MRLYVNDLSFRNDVQIDEPENIVKSFLDVCNRVKKYSFDKIHMPADYKSRELVTGYSLGSFLASKPKSSLLYQKLKGIMANQFIVFDHQAFEEVTIQYVRWNNQESEFLKQAFNTDTPSISLKTLHEPN